jgi:hypothetical protein
MSLHFWKTLSKSFWRSFSFSADSITVMALLRFTKLEVPEYKLEMWLLTWTADNFTANTVPLLTKVVLDALQAVKS